MKRRPVRYTLLLARSGGGSRALSLPGWVLLLLLGLLLAWTGVNLYLWQRTSELRSLKLQVQALSQAVRQLNLALEAARTENRTLEKEAEKAKEELSALRKAIEELRKRAGLPPLKATPIRYAPGGQGGGALGAWAEVQVGVLDLRNQLRELTPALERTLELEASLPRGFPLRWHQGFTSFFGMRRNPFGPGWEFHDGVDLDAPFGAPVYATGAGVVRQAGWMGPYGLAVLVEHLEGYATLYAHLSRIAVRVGERVERGQLVGYVGSTGRSTGPHLHYGIYRYGRPLNPLPYLQGSLR